MALHSRTITLTCCFSAAATAVFGPLLTREPASASEEDTASEPAVVFSLTVFDFFLLDAEAVDRCII